MFICFGQSRCSVWEICMTREEHVVFGFVVVVPRLYRGPVAVELFVLVIHKRCGLVSRASCMQVCRAS